MPRTRRTLLPFRPHGAGAWLRAAEIAALAALLAAALPRTAAAQAVGSTPVEARHQAAPRERLETGGFPDPFWLSLLTAVLAGVAGAAAAERVCGGERTGRPGAAGLLEKLVVGPVAAVALLGINPPGVAWPALAGTAAAGGAAAQALLLASAHARRAQAAEARRDAADEGARRTVVLAGEQMETLRRLAVEGSGMIGSGSAPAVGWERALDVYAERARVELLHVARRAPAPARATPHAAHTPEPAA
jgi:hypothetical protein